MPAYSAALVALCVLVFVSDIPPGSVLAQGLLWMPLIAAGQLTAISILPELDVDASLASIVIVAAALLLPPQAVVLFTFVGLLSPQEVRREATVVMALFNRAQFALSGAAAGYAAMLVSGGATWRLIVASAAASMMFEVANIAWMTVMLVVRRGRRLRQALEEMANPFPRFALNTSVSATLSLLLAVLVRDVGAWSVALLVAPLWLSHSAQESARRAEDRAEELAARVLQLEMLNRISRELLSVRGVEQVPAIAAPALESTLGAAVAVRLDGASDAEGGPAVAVVGHEPAAIVIPDGIPEQATAVIDAVAALIGLTLTRLQLETELAETERARTALTGRILEEATHERSRIAMGIHDDVLPLFAAAQMKIDTLEMVLERDDPVRSQEMADSAMQAVTDGISELRDTLEALRGSTLVPGTLREGVQKLLAELNSRTGIRGVVHAPADLPQLPFAVELLAFETLRGCVANVEKHAGATSLDVALQADDGKLVVLMRDDGRGFDPTTIGQRSHGLALMRQRAELARGSFAISNRDVGGTEVRLEVPTW